MLAIIIGIGCVIASFAIQSSLRAQGVEPLTRGQLRYMRKKARRQGVTVDQIKYKPRRRK
ncbi:MULTISPECIES: ABC transporter permease [unclassified Sphingomonas]|uniref:ABC transporter permease n=1 Tax=unclassified Sphingomonas TaxID=196159 RepID=UPI00226A0827|nr:MULTISPECIES: ABC transporter permease [unclassified Sphingomonas]